MYWYNWPWLVLNIKKALHVCNDENLNLKNNKSIPSCPYNLLCFDWFSYLPFLQTEKNNIGREMGKAIRTNKLFLAFSYCNLFFKMSKHIKRWWDAISQKHPVRIPVLPRGYGLISSAWLTNQITGLVKIFHSSRICVDIIIKIS